MQRLRSRRMFLMGFTSVRLLKKKTLNSWAAVCDTFLSTKDIFERHKMVFTIGSSLASVATAWAGYSLRHYHQSNVDRRLESIEYAMKNNHHLVNSELEKLVNPGGSHITACIATAGTTFVIGYGLGWRGGRWYAARKVRKEQMKQQVALIKAKKFPFLGRIRPNSFRFHFLGQQLPKIKLQEPPPSPTSSNFKF